VLTPSSLAFTTAGDTATVVADPRDAAGNSLAGRAVTWSSGDPTVASVSATGLVTAVGTGSTTITGTSEGVSGNAAVSVGTPPPTANLTNECQNPQPGWVWCDDFDVDRLGSYFEYNDDNGDFIRVNGVGEEGSWGMRAKFQTGETAAGELHLALGRTPIPYFRPADAGTADYRELYWRMYVRHQTGWVGGGARKLSRAFIFAGGDWSQAMVAHVWAGDPSKNKENTLILDPVSGTNATGVVQTTKYNDFPNFQWLGSRQAPTPIFDAAHVGQWYCVEAHVRLNTSGQADGVFELWIDDAFEAGRNDLDFVDTYNGFGLNAVYFENFWNEGSPQLQERYFDNIVVSTQRIGC